MGVEAKVIEEKIRSAIPDTTVVELTDLTGTLDHWQALIVSPSFAGQSRVEQHRTVYGALNELMAGSAAPVHALALTTLTPEAYEARQTS
jgi:stress-induced morphogen